MRILVRRTLILRIYLALWGSVGAISMMANGSTKIHVFPAAFSEESIERYGSWIDKLKASGFGNAVWQEIEDYLYDYDEIEIIFTPETSEMFSELIEAIHSKEPLADGKFLLPDFVITINTNVFQERNETLRVFASKTETIYHTTIYLRLYDLRDGYVNRAIPANGDGTSGDPIVSARNAVKNALVKLMRRSSKSGVWEF